MNIEEIYDTYAETVYRFFYIKSFDKALAEDLTSQTFMALVDRMQNDPDSIIDSKKFLYGIMRNTWLLYLKEKYRRNEALLEDIDDFSQYVTQVVEEYQSEDEADRVRRFIDKLPQQQRDIVIRRLIDDVSIKDIALEIGKDRNYVKTTYKRGVNRVRTLMTQYATEGEEVTS